MEIYDKSEDMPSEIFKNIQDIIAGAFKYEKGNFERAKYIVERLRNLYGNVNYNFCCIVGDKYSYGAFYSYYKNILLRCNFEDKYIVLFSGK